MVQHLNQSAEAEPYYDSTVNYNDSDIISVTTRGAAGKIGDAVEFQADDYINIPDAGVDSALDLSGDGSITLSAWIHATGPGEIAAIRAGILSKGYTLRIDGSNCTGYGDYTIKATRSDNWNGPCGSANNAAPNSWSHVVYVYDSATYDHYLYINGILDRTRNLPAGASDSVSDLRIGEWNGLSFEGYIDEVRISNTKRSVEWIKASYNNQNA